MHITLLTMPTQVDGVFCNLCPPLSPLPGIYTVFLCTVTALLLLASGNACVRTLSSSYLLTTPMQIHVGGAFATPAGHVKPQPMSYRGPSSPSLLIVFTAQLPAILPHTVSCM